MTRGGADEFAGFLGQRRGDIINYGYSQTTTVGTTMNAAGAPIPRSWDNAKWHAVREVVTEHFVLADLNHAGYKSIPRNEQKAARDDENDCANC